LQKARAACDRLIVGVTTDELIAKTRGSLRYRL
jgi:bifunctional ADP-heptose synthase (sugar kinase/adenylyltransferase)